MRRCGVSECETKHYSKGFCLRHYRAWRTHGDPLVKLNGRGLPAIERFSRRYVVAENGCWHWTGRLNDGSYGVFSPSHEQTISAHRWSYEFFLGPIPEGFTVDHRCHNDDRKCAGGTTCLHRRCVNPFHMEAVPLRTNLLRGNTLPAHNARKTHCPRNHPYDGIGFKGERTCLRCNAEKQRRYLERKRAKAS